VVVLGETRRGGFKSKRKVEVVVDQEDGFGGFSALAVADAV
jgi:hypothetical protein